MSATFKTYTSRNPFGSVRVNVYRLFVVTWSSSPGAGVVTFGSPGISIVAPVSARTVVHGASLGGGSTGAAGGLGRGRAAGGRVATGSGVVGADGFDGVYEIL